MNVFDRIEKATMKARASWESVTLQLSDEEYAQWLDCNPLVGNPMFRGGMAAKQHRDSGSGPLRVYLENGSNFFFVSV